MGIEVAGCGWLLGNVRELHPSRETKKLGPSSPRITDMVISSAHLSCPHLSAKDGRPRNFSGTIILFPHREKKWCHSRLSPHSSPEFSSRIFVCPRIFRPRIFHRHQNHQASFSNFSYVRASSRSPNFRQTAASSLYTYDRGGPSVPDWRHSISCLLAAVKSPSSYRE